MGIKEKKEPDYKKLVLKKIPEATCVYDPESESYLIMIHGGGRGINNTCSVSILSKIRESAKEAWEDAYNNYVR